MPVAGWLPLVNRGWLLATFLLIVACGLFVPVIAQKESYHTFADARTIWGIPNFFNVVSNLPFAIIGALGLWRLHGPVARVLFTGFLLTSFGSTYYHLMLGDARLVWDRLPMTLVFMSFVTWIVADGRSPRAEIWILVVLVFCGAASVLWWRMTGDLRPYALVQFGPALLILPALLRASGRRYLGGVIGFYTLAKVAEIHDDSVYSVSPLSGHTWKHILAALAGYCIYRWRCDSLQTVTPPSGRNADCGVVSS